MVVLLVVAFLVVTWYESSRKGGRLWKSSVLPVLIHGLHDPELAQHMASPADIRQRAESRQAWVEEVMGSRPVWKTNA